MDCRLSSNHGIDCFSGAIDVAEISGKEQSSVEYPDLQSARRPVMEFQ